MFSLAARHAVAPTAAVRADRRSVTTKRAASAIVRAEGGESAPAKPAAPAAWSAPKLNPNTPSPIFGGSTGGLLRKAQVRIDASEGTNDGSKGSRPTARDTRPRMVMDLGRTRDARG